MIPLPSLPTDNMYKFIAVAALALFGVGFVGPFFVKKERRDHTSKINRESDERFRANLAAVVQLVDADPLMADPERRRQELHDQAQRLEAAEAERRKAEVVQTDRTAAQHWAYLIYARIGGLLGATVGFWLWYYRVQRHLDQLLRDDVVRARASTGRSAWTNGVALRN